MANVQSFPLLRLPNLAREHVVMVMDVREQYLFAKLSKMSKKVAKVSVRRQSYLVEWVLKLDQVDVKIQKAGNQDGLKIEILAMNKRTFIPYLSNDIHLNVTDIKEHSMELLTFLNDIFKISSFKLVASQIPNDFTKQFLTAVQDFGIGIDELKVEVGKRGNEIFGWIMENCRDVKRLTNHCYTTHDFQWDSQKPFTFDYLYILTASWLTLDHLRRLFMNCRFFEVNQIGNDLRVKDLNQLVKMWMIESRLEFVKIDTELTLNFRGIMHDIDKEPFYEAYIANEFYSLGQAYKIRQQCGREAVVCMSGRKFIITSHFDNPRCDFWAVPEEEEEDDEEEEEDN